MRVQRRSQGFLRGVNPAHEKAVATVIKFWNKFRNDKYEEWMIDNAWVEQYDKKFIKENPDKNKDHFFHMPDICFWVWNAYEPYPKLMIEVDGESHSALTRKISDKIFEKWIGTHYSGKVQVIRLQKVELLGEQKDVEEYLRKKLKGFLK